MSTSQEAVGWVICTVGHNGALKVDWDGEFYQERLDALKALTECRNAGHDCHTFALYPDELRMGVGA